MKTTFVLAGLAAMATANPFHWPWNRPTATTTAVFTTPTPGGYFTTPTPSGDYYYGTPTPTPGGQYTVVIPPQPVKPKPKFCTLICANKPITTCGKGWHTEKTGDCWSCCTDKHSNLDRRNMGRELRVVD